MEYSYPISNDWSVEEIIQVIDFFEGVEQAYEKGIVREDILAKYRQFKEIVPSKAEEKTLFKEFREVSGYESYPVVKLARELKDGQIIRLEQQKKKYRK